MKANSVALASSVFPAASCAIASVTAAGASVSAIPDPDVRTALQAENARAWTVNRGAMCAGDDDDAA